MKLTLEQFSGAVSESWSVATAHPFGWDPELPAAGQDAATACVVEDYFGFKVVRTTTMLPDLAVRPYYLNRVPADLIPEGVLDLTAGQPRNGPDLHDAVAGRGGMSRRYEILRTDGGRARYERLASLVAANVLQLAR